MEEHSKDEEAVFPWDLDSSTKQTHKNASQNKLFYDAIYYSEKPEYQTNIKYW